MRLLDIGEAVGRGEATIARAVRGLKRERPPPPRGRHAARNDRIVATLVESGKTHAHAARRFGQTPRTAHVAAHPRSCCGAGGQPRSRLASDWNCQPSCASLPGGRSNGIT